MRYFVQEKGLGIRGASREVEKLTDGSVTADRADNVYRKRVTASNDAPKPTPGETCAEKSPPWSFCILTRKQLSWLEI